MISINTINLILTLAIPSAAFAITGLIAWGGLRADVRGLTQSIRDLTNTMRATENKVDANSERIARIEERLHTWKM